MGCFCKNTIFRYPFPDIFGYNVQVGTATSIGVTFQQISRLSLPYGNCTVSTLNNKVTFFVIFRINDLPAICTVFNIQQKVVSVLSTKTTWSLNATVMILPTFNQMEQPSLSAQFLILVSFFYNLNTTTTNCLDACWDSQSNSTSSNDTCTQPCNEGVYDVTVSSAKWPSVTLTAVADCVNFFVLKTTLNKTLSGRRRLSGKLLQSLFNKRSPSWSFLPEVELRDYGRVAGLYCFYVVVKFGRTSWVVVGNVRHFYYWILGSFLPGKPQLKF